jgi:hypothetical protein
MSEKKCVPRPEHDAILPDREARGVDDFAAETECILGVEGLEVESVHAHVPRDPNAARGCVDRQ